MYKKSLRAISAAIVSAFVATPLLFTSDAQAEDRYADRWEVGGQLGGLLLEGDSKFVPHLQGGARAGYNLDNNIAGELSLLVGKSGVEDTPKNATTYLPTTEALYHFGQNEDLRPFVAGGIGVFSSDGPPGASSTDVVFPLGGGVKWMLSDNLLTRADARWVINTGEGDDFNQGYYSVGLSWLFDAPPQKPKEVPARAAAPAPVEKSSRFPEAAKALEKDKKASIKLLVQFDTDKTDIKERYRKHLLEVAEFLNDHPNTVTEIEGHTDNTASKKHNQSLSLRRAQAVRHFLLNEGKVNPSKLVAKGYWFSRPVASNATEEGRALNRRVIASIRAVK